MAFGLSGSGAALWSAGWAKVTLCEARAPSVFPWLCFLCCLLQKLRRPDRLPDAITQVGLSWSFYWKPLLQQEGTLIGNADLLWSLSLGQAAKSMGQWYLLSRKKGAKRKRGRPGLGPVVPGAEWLQLLLSGPPVSTGLGITVLEFLIMAKPKGQALGCFTNHCFWSS